jgi:oxygen-independent coproporphyrinogen-3 oxidase
MAGIYLHIPFCKKACHYCNFHFSTQLQGKNDFIECLLKEINIQQNFLEGAAVKTIYWGGGTPSLLEVYEIERILTTLYQHHNISASAEVTLEINPDDITDSQLLAWRKAGINRLSIGVQSFFEEDLLWMNRVHSAQQAINGIKIAQEAGFANITIDLIYGTPGLTDAKWKQNVQTALQLNIPHLSCYALTVEPNTALDKMIQQQKKENIDTDQQARQFLLLMDWLSEAGYEHYEISNFAKQGFRSRHNSAYWQGVAYLGLGPSAHSFNGNKRQWNVSNNTLYIQRLQKGELLYEEETLTMVQQLNEYIMTSLRSIEGINIDRVARQFGTTAADKLRFTSEPYVKTGKLQLVHRAIILTREGKLLADGIAADLFQE